MCVLPELYIDKEATIHLKDLPLQHELKARSQMQPKMTAAVTLQAAAVNNIFLKQCCVK